MISLPADTSDTSKTHQTLGVTNEPHCDTVPLTSAGQERMLAAGLTVICLITHEEKDGRRLVKFSHQISLNPIKPGCTQSLQSMNEENLVEEYKY